MKIIEKIAAKQKNNWEAPAVSIAFLGDSVTQGCFELYVKSDNESGTVFDTIYDKNSAYHNYIARIFSVLCPNVPVNIINAGVSGNSAVHGLSRVERDVLSYNPDLVVVCFGLNDSMSGMEKITDYISALSEIFDKIKASGAELIFMTPNVMCSKVSCHITDKRLIEVAENTVKIQTEGVLDEYIAAAKRLCAEKNVTVCDCYAKWKLMDEYGIDTAELMANKTNHPLRDMNWLFAYSLVETMFTEK